MWWYHITSPCLALTNNSRDFHLLPPLAHWQQFSTCEEPHNSNRSLLQGCPNQKPHHVGLCVWAEPAYPCFQTVAYLPAWALKWLARSCLLLFLRKYPSQQLDFIALALFPLLILSLSIQKYLSCSKGFRKKKPTYMLTFFISELIIWPSVATSSTKVLFCKNLFLYFM